MPELPDIDLYVEKLDRLVKGSTLERIRIANPFLVRTVDPPITAAHGRDITELRRIGKRIVFGLAGDYWLILHLMIAGRLHWQAAGSSLTGRNRLAAFDFADGTLLLTEAGTQKRASLHLVLGREALRAHDPGGVEPLGCTFRQFSARLMQENRTLKRALTNPRTFSGIGNAYSDEILHAARLSPIQHTHRLEDAERRRLFDAMRTVLADWRTRLRDECGDAFPENVTAFREGMAVHGRFGKPCPTCGAIVRRIRYKSNETNYCPRCQTRGRILADRSLSRLLRDDWPGKLDD